MTEKQTIRESLEQQRQQKLSEGKTKQAEFLAKVQAYVERTYNEDMTAKDPYNKPENIVEGKEIRIGEERE